MKYPRTATAELLGLTKKEFAVLKRLSTPFKIQAFLDTLPVNWEKGHETYMSPRRVLREGKAHCIEAALLACLALWAQGKETYIMDLKSINGDDHVVALYKINGYWGAMSKTNHATLRFRDPVYRTVRELALSYFHEYIHLKTGKKILESYSKPFDIKQLGTAWITAEEELFHIAQALDDAPHERIFPKKNASFLRKADHMELKMGQVIEWKEDDPRT